MTVIRNDHTDSAAEQRDRGRREARADALLNATPVEIDREVDQLPLDDETKAFLRRIIKVLLFSR